MRSHAMTSNISTKSQKEILKFVRERTHTIPILALEQFHDHLLPQTLANDRVKLVLESIGIEEIRNYVATIRERVDGGRVSVFDHLQLIFDVVESKGKEVLNIDPCGRISRSADGTNAVGRFNITQLDSASRNDKSKLSRITATLALKEQSTYGTVMENYLQAIWDMQSIMHGDARRRFVYAVSIEEQNTRMWFCCRAGKFVSEIFDYVERIEVLLDIFVRLAFSDELDLGWDNSIEQVNEIAYRVRAGSKWYITKALLSDVTARRSEGRSTRVWEAYDEYGQHVVLKDVWLDDGWKSEHEMLEEIKSKEQDESYLDMVKQHFFEVVSSDAVMINGHGDDTKGLIMRGMQLLGYRHFLVVSSDGVEELVATHPASAFESARHGHGHVIHRNHFRVVFQDLATPLTRVESIGDVFLACHHAMFVVAFLAKHGYVHRDISEGNIYIHEGRGIVADFEFAKIIGDGGLNDLRRGTPKYWAVEVDNEGYMFGSLVTAGHPLCKIGSTGSLSNSKREEHEAHTETGSTRFIHNPLHDVESLWWICVKRVFNYQVTLDDDNITGAALLARQRETASRIFPCIRTADKRAAFLCSKEVHDECMSALHPRLKAIGDILSRIREELVKLYTEAEADIQNIREYSCDQESLLVLTDLFDDGIDAAESLESNEFEGEQSTVDIRSSQGKRSREEVVQSGFSVQCSGEPPTKECRYAGVYIPEPMA